MSRGKWIAYLVGVALLGMITAQIVRSSEEEPAELDKEDQQFEVSDFEAGDCADWDPEDPVATSRVVECSEPHYIEFAGSVVYESELDDPYPSSATWNAYFDNACVDMVEEYLGKPVAAGSELDVGGFFPTEELWDLDERTVWCGLQKFGPDRDAVLFTGSASEIL